MNSPVALAAGELAVPDDDRAALTARPRWPPWTVTALVARVVDVHVVGRRRDRALAVRVVDDEVRVGADADRALRGYIPNSLAGAVEMISTQRSFVIRPPTTPPSWSRSTRSSTPGRPFGIFRKSPRPSSFWPWKSNGQWSVETTCRSSFDEAGPQVVPVVLRAERRRAHELRALEPVARGRRATGTGTAGTSRRTPSSRDRVPPGPRRARRSPTGGRCRPARRPPRPGG